MYTYYSVVTLGLSGLLVHYSTYVVWGWQEAGSATAPTPLLAPLSQGGCQVCPGGGPGRSLILYLGGGGGGQGEGPVHHCF